MIQVRVSLQIRGGEIIRIMGAVCNGWTKNTISVRHYTRWCGAVKLTCILWMLCRIVLRNSSLFHLQHFGRNQTKRKSDCSHIVLRPLLFKVVTSVKL